MSSSAQTSQRHFVSASDLPESEIQFLFGLARGFRSAASDLPPLLKGKTVAHLFFENSTRTRLSFEVATRKLGGQTLGFAAAGSSVAKGEALLDTVRNIAAMDPHGFVIRHSGSGVPKLVAERVGLPVVNAGDGINEHPTQALLDAFTITEKLGSVAGKRVLIVGDVLHSRVARSNIRLLKTLGAKVECCGPPTLAPARPDVLGIEWHDRLDRVLAAADVVMMLRIQSERHGSGQVPNLGEYARFWGLNAERAATLKSDAIVLHPGPMNRGIEIDAEVADGPRSLILTQVSNGVLVRMALLATLLNRRGVQEWLDKGGKRV